MDWEGCVTLEHLWLSCYSVSVRLQGPQGTVGFKPSGRANFTPVTAFVRWHLSVLACFVLLPINFDFTQKKDRKESKFQVHRCWRCCRQRPVHAGQLCFHVAVTDRHQEECELCSGFSCEYTARSASMCGKSSVYEKRGSNRTSLRSLLHFLPRNLW